MDYLYDCGAFEDARAIERLLDDVDLESETGDDLLVLQSTAVVKAAEVARVLAKQKPHAPSGSSIH